MGINDSLLNEQTGSDHLRPPEASAVHGPCRHHLLIAGTGRAGTSSLVQYLSRVGLETHLTKSGEAVWDQPAEAGLEDLPFSVDPSGLPYVIKSPWSYQLIDQLLTDKNVELDAVLVPIRDLVEAASSRSIVQLQAMHREAPWMAQMRTPWEHWGTTPGGSVFSLNPIDQARLLAVGFHQLLERLAPTDIPVVFLAFPRFTNDADYLLRKLSPVLPINLSVRQAREAHALTFRPTKVRTGRELTDITTLGLVPNMSALDNAALKRELERSRRVMTVLRDELAALGPSRTALHNEFQSEMAVLRNEIATLHGVQTALDKELRVSRSEITTLYESRIALDKELRNSRSEIAALRGSRSWRLTAPIRIIASGIRRILQMVGGR